MIVSAVDVGELTRDFLEKVLLILSVGQARECPLFASWR